MPSFLSRVVMLSIVRMTCFVIVEEGYKFGILWGESWYASAVFCCLALDISIISVWKFWSWCLLGLSLSVVKKWGLTGVSVGMRVSPGSDSVGIGPLEVLVSGGMNFVIIV